MITELKGAKATMKRIIMAISIIIIVAFLSACGESALSTNTNSKSNQDRYSDLLLSEDSFSEEFNNSEGFQSIKADVISLYNLVRTAYEESDKESLSSFSIDLDEFDFLYNSITDKVDSYDRSKDDITIMLRAAINAANINKSIAEINLLYAADSNGKNIQFFETLEHTLNTVYQDYTQSQTETIEETSIITDDEKENEDPIVGKWELVHMEEMGTLPINSAKQIEASVGSIPIFECGSETFNFEFKSYGININKAWEAVDAKSIEGVNRDILQSYKLDDSQELAAYFGATDHSDYKYIYLKIRINGVLYEMRFKRAN